MIKSHVNSLLNSVSYRFGAILVDPGDEWEGFYNVEAVLLTHGHFDHIYGLNRVIEINPSAKIYTNQFGVEMLSNSKKNMSHYQGEDFKLLEPRNVEIVENNRCVILNQKTIVPIFTPGHNPSCITWIVDGYIFTGDSYIPGIKTVTNLPGGDKNAADNSTQLIQTLINDKTVCPGHKI